MMRPLAILGVGHVSMPDLAPAAPLKLDLGLLERTLRRGLSDTTRLFMHTAKIALAEAAVAPERVHVIFASAFGEIATAEALLLEAHEQNGSSPARFRNSVHNTTTGLFSISTKNYLPSTAIAAGWSTVAMALCEASAQLACGAERVLLVFAEERVPLALSADHSHGALGAAFVLARAGESPARATIRNMRLAAPGASERALDERSHPLAPALELAHAVERAELRTLVVGEGPPPLCIDIQPEVAA
jgi:hypothetical protein